MRTEVHLFGDGGYAVVEWDEVPVGPFIVGPIPDWWLLALIGGREG